MRCLLCSNPATHTVYTTGGNWPPDLAIATCQQHTTLLLAGNDASLEAPARPREVVEVTVTSPARIAFGVGFAIIAAVCFFILGRI